GNSHNGLRPYITYNESGQVASCCNKKFQVIISGHLYQVLNSTPAAPFAIINIICYPDVAITYLQAMRQEQQYPLCPVSLRLRFDQPVIQINNIALEQ